MIFNKYLLYYYWSLCTHYLFIFGWLLRVVVRRLFCKSKLNIQVDICIMNYTAALSSYYRIGILIQTRRACIFLIILFPTHHILVKLLFVSIFIPGGPENLWVGILPRYLHCWGYTHPKLFQIIIYSKGTSKEFS